MSSCKRVEVTVGSRIHISLADLGHVSPRLYGGVGFMIDRPVTKLLISPQENFSVHGLCGIDNSGRSDVERIVNEFSGLNSHGAKIEIYKLVPQHSGFGSKTALLLALVSGLNAFFSMGLSRNEEQLLSRRGGGSGVGIHGFYEGGVLWDAGHDPSQFTHFSPSSRGRPSVIPPLVARFPFPTDWRIGLCLPDGKHVSGADEEIFFKRQTPVDRMSTLEAISLLYHGILPAFRLADLELLKESLSKLRKVGFKSREVSFQGNHVLRLIEKFEQLGVAAGMSSVGPLVYTVFDGTGEQEDLIRRLCLSSGAQWLGVARGLNSGASVDVEFVV